MTFTAFDPQGRAYDLGEPVSVRIDRDEDAPADGLSGTFLLRRDLPDLLLIRVEDQGQTIFSGQVDELERQVSPTGTLLRITGRSRAALLLDNEAMPQSYYGPSLKNIFRRHAAPYGFTTYVGDSGYKSGEYRIGKGISEWQAISTFCIRYLGQKPVLGRDGILYVKPRSFSGALFFSNSAGTPFLSAILRQRYCERLSEVLIQGADGWYSSRLADDRVRSLGISRKRYCSLSDGAATAGRLLQASQRAGREVVVTCPGWPDAELTMHGTVEDPALGRLTGLSVAKLTWLADSRGPRCVVVLRQADG